MDALPPPIEVTPARLFRKIGELVIENEVLREQAAAAAPAPAVDERRTPAGDALEADYRATGLPA